MREDHVIPRPVTSSPSGTEPFGDRQKGTFEHVKLLSLCVVEADLHLDRKSQEDTSDADHTIGVSPIHSDREDITTCDPEHRQAGQVGMSQVHPRGELQPADGSSTSAP